MGKSTSSCLKIITCGRGGDEAHDDGDLASPESKASSGKRRWSFRKKSSSQRVLSNTVISEPVSVGYSKESIDVTTDNFQPSKESSIQEKLLILERPKETAPLSLAVVNPDIVTNSLVTDRNIAVADHTVQESVAVVIQVSIRIFLARRELQKLKNVVKLQAAVRGHLVRRQAVGTLRCVQAIAKMQSLVRARRARNLAEKFDAHKDKNFHMGRRNGKMNKENSTEKLLSNGFARQLLESTPKTKPINIKCDPSKSDSAWKWLERWMAVTSSEVGQRQRQDYDQLYKRQEESSKLHDHEAAVDEDTFAAVSISSDSKSGPSETVVPTEIQENLSTKDFGGFEFQSLDNARDSCVNSLAMGDKDQSLVENKSIGTKPDYDRKLESVVENTDSFLGQIPSQSDVTSQLVLDSIPDKGESDSNNSKSSNKRDSREPLETEGKKFVSGTRKPCNPAFAAVQSKFEELSSTTSLGRSVSSCPDATSEVEPLSNTKNHSLTENSFSHDPGAQLAASECGTEISISSTLDSPDRSEAEGGEIVIELGALGKQNYDVNGAGDNSLNMVHTNAEANNSSLDLQFLQSEREEELDRNTEKSIAASDAVGMEKQTEDLITSDMRAQAGNVVDPQAYKSSPEGTPRSHATAFESHGTPSSQASVNAKKSKGDNKILTKKQRAQLIGKKSPSNPNNDSDGSSAEHLPKESKKRRNSLGVTIHEQVDHEPRTSSSNSIPSYMQATESAKAKAHATISPKSSPDVHDKDIHMKKRHSLPIGNGKQGSSPRMQRSASKANGTHSPHNSAERRWQR